MLRPNMTFRASSSTEGIETFVELRAHDRTRADLLVMGRLGGSRTYLPWGEALRLAHHIIACHQTIYYGPTLPIESPNASSAS